MKSLRKVLLSIWLAVWIFVGIAGILAMPQAKKDSEFVRKFLMPGADFVNGFKHTNGRLPTQSEFQTWVSLDSNTRGNIDYIRNDSQIANHDVVLFRNADWNEDFAVGAWRGEWLEYYFSWKNGYYVGNDLWDFQIISLLLGGLILYLTIVAIPFAIINFFQKGRNPRILKNKSTLECLQSYPYQLILCFIPMRYSRP